MPRDASHLVYRSMVRGFEAMGVPLPGVRLSCTNAIPHGRGLGSSSAAIVAGLAAARALVDDGCRAACPTSALFALAAEIEGHPDNVAPAVLRRLHDRVRRRTGRRVRGRAARRRPGRLRSSCSCRRWPSRPGSRGASCPSQVPHADAARNAGRAALLVAALTGRPDQLMAATEDRLHQQYRAAAMPESARLIETLRAAGFAAVVSGAGPTVLALVDPAAVSEVLGHAPERLAGARAGRRRRRVFGRSERAGVLRCFRA